MDSRELGAIESAGVGRGVLIVARVRFTVKRPILYPVYLKDEDARKLIREDWRERESMEGKRGINYVQLR